MTLIFSEEERRYIVEDFETDLLLTKVGILLVEKFTTIDNGILINASEMDIEEFLVELREEYISKVERISRSDILRTLAQRLLPDFFSIETEKWYFR